MTTSLLAHIAKGFASRQWENIATESLHYLLRRQAAQEAVTRLLSEAGLFTAGLRWVTQATNDDGSRPDLVGLDQERRPAVVIEVKFWASLTDNQPTSYLAGQEKAFPDRPNDHLLVFLVPGNRQHVIVGELKRRLLEGRDAVESAGMTATEYLASRSVSVVTWSRMLGEIRVSLTAAGDTDGLEDLHQLKGLCDRADAEAMLPIASEEVDSVHARRYRDYVHLANQAGKILVQSEAVSTEGLRQSDGYWGVGRFIKTRGGVTFWFGFYPRYWSDHYATPWWLQLSLHAAPEAHEALGQLGRDPRIPYVGDDNGRPVLAVPVPVGVEAEEAAQALADFVLLVFGLLEQSDDM